MSLLNQMLTDLEKRRGDTSSPALPTLQSLNPPASRLRPTVLAAVGGVVVLGALAYWYLPGTTVPRAAPSPEAAAPVVTPAANTAPVASPPVVAASSEVAPLPAPAQVQPVPAAATAKAIDASPAAAPQAKATIPAPAVAPSAPAPAAFTPPVTASAPPPFSAPVAKGASNVSPGQARKTESPQQKADFLYRQGLNALQHGRNAEAVPLLQQAVQNLPDGIEARQTLAVTLMMQGRGHEAEPVLLDGLQRAPGQGALSQLLGRLQLERGQLPQAQATLEKALAVASNDPQLNGLLALVSQRQGQHPKAATHFLAALRSDPTMPAWLTGLATSWEAMGMRTEAREALERALQSGRMSEDLAAYARQKLAQLN